MGLDDLGSLAAEVRERVRARREALAKSEAESAAWLERLARVTRDEEHVDWSSSGSGPYLPVVDRSATGGQPPAASPFAAPMSWMSEPVSARNQENSADSLVLELGRRNEELTNDLAATRAALLDLQLRNDALVIQVAALRTAYERRMSGSPRHPDTPGFGDAESARERVSADAADTPEQLVREHASVLARLDYETAPADASPVSW